MSVRVLVSRCMYVYVCVCVKKKEHIIERETDIVIAPISRQKETESNLASGLMVFAIWYFF